MSKEIEALDLGCLEYDCSELLTQIDSLIDILENSLKPSACKNNETNNKEMINHPSHYNMGKFEAIDVFKSITGEMTRLFEIKNKNYGNSFSKQFDEYGLTSVCIRLEDKLNRLKSLSKQGDNANVDDESLRDTLIDLANYSVLSIMEIDKRK